MRGSWVTITIVSPLACMRSKISRISRPVFVSRLPVGSSARMREGWLTMARAIAARCRWPPESSDGRCFARSRRPTSVERREGLLLPLGAGDAGVEERQLDVAQERGLGQQVEGLEDEADLLVADRGELEAGELRDVLAVQAVGALGRRVEAAEDVHEGGLAGARGADDRDHLALLDLEVDPAERLHGQLARVVGLGDPLHADEGGDGHGGGDGAGRHRRHDGHRLTHCPSSPSGGSGPRPRSPCPR